jgi:hypothetical protein
MKFISNGESIEITPADIRCVSAGVNSKGINQTMLMVTDDFSQRVTPGRTCLFIGDTYAHALLKVLSEEAASVAKTEQVRAKGFLAAISADWKATKEFFTHGSK